MNQYLDLLEYILKDGERRENRTGIDTIGIFGAQMRFDLSKGFPLVTTKKVFWKGVVEELLWFISGSTNVRPLQNRGVYFWDEWSKDDGSLGPVYGQQLRRIERIEFKEPLLFTPTDRADIPEFSKEIVIDYKSGSSSILGRVLSTKSSGKATVIKQCGTKSNGGTFIVKFHDTGATREVPYGLCNEALSDFWKPTVWGIGVYGDYDTQDPYYDVLVTTWRDMIRRCYSKETKSYKSYGGKGVHVSPQWLVFSNFQRDVKKIPGWDLKKLYPSEYSLDKDMSVSNRYSIETCRWASDEEQRANGCQITPFSATDPDGNRHSFYSLGYCAKTGNLNVSAVHRCLNGSLRSHKGWSEFSYIYRPPNTVPTVRIVDQLKETLAMLKSDPTTRRAVISLWNPALIERMALPPCHGNVIQFYVSKGKLSCHMYQRSADMFLGVPVNIASYALLTHMVAHVTGLGVGEFIHSFGDAHIYVNHLDQIKEQIIREPFPLPAVEINPDKKDIFDIGYDDITLKNYKFHPPIKGEVAV